MINFIKKYAELDAGQEDIDLSFDTGWRDEYGNITAVVTIDGKKHCFIGEDNSSSWNYCSGIGTSPKLVSKDTPAGIGQYLIGKSLDKGNADKLTKVVSDNKGKLKIIPNKSGAAWSPKNESQKSALKFLVKTYESINSYLSSVGLLFSEGNKKIYGKDITEGDIDQLNVASGPAAATQAPSTPASALPKATPATNSVGSGQQASGDTPNVTAFIPFLKEEFRAVFGRELNKISTFRSAIQQAQAMRFPIRDGTYDQLYGRIPGAEQIKDLINSERYEEAANIILKTKLAQGSHMAGKAIDVPFGPNGLRSSDFDRFQRMIASASKRSGINASINFEKVSHFHINVN
jgi:hypothetical protein